MESIKITQEEIINLVSTFSQSIKIYRECIIAIFGNPDHISTGSRKYKTPAVFKYGNIEFHFLPYKDGHLMFVQEVKEQGQIKNIFWSSQI